MSTTLSTKTVEAASTMVRDKGPGGLAGKVIGETAGGTLGGIAGEMLGDGLDAVLQDSAERMADERDAYFQESGDWD